MDKRKLMMALCGVLMVSLASALAAIELADYWAPHSFVDHGDAGVVFILFLLPIMGIAGGVSVILGFCCQKAENEVAYRRRTEQLARELFASDR